MNSGWLALAVPIIILFAATTIISYARLPIRIKFLLCTAIFLRIAGASLYYGVMSSTYGGGDFQMYFAQGATAADRIADHDYSPFLDRAQWLGEQWWGSQMIVFIAAIIIATTGKSLLGAFFICASLGLVGLMCFVRAFRISYPDIPLTAYLAWICFFPSLWFWPSVLGKEPVILLGLGVCTMAYVGKRDKMKWPLLLVGLTIVFSVRPQVAAVFAASMLVAQWLNFDGRWSVMKTLQGVVLTGVCLGALWAASSYLGLGLEVQEVSNYMRTKGDLAATGVLATNRAAVGWRGIPTALMNILMRPFPWEARNATTLLSSIEIGTLWAIVLIRRGRVFGAIAAMRKSRLGRISLAFVLLYSVMLGMVVVNLGIIARQRIVLFPFIFVLLVAGYRRRDGRQWLVSPVRRPQPAARAGDLLPKSAV